MGFIRKLDANVDIQTFPGAKFELTGEVPAPQCSEAQIESITGIIGFASTLLRDPGKFVGWALGGKFLTVTLPIGEAGTYQIFGNDDDKLTTEHAFLADDDAVNYFVHNGGALILTRNVPSFAQFIHAAGYAYTIKGGKLYTNMPSGQLKDACTILFDPIT